jgi:hypothetical protein
VLDAPFPACVASGVVVMAVHDACDPEHRDEVLSALHAGDLDFWFALLGLDDSITGCGK